MTIWLDAQLSPAIAAWITNQFGISAASLRDLGLRDSTDRNVFLAAREARAVVMTKDEDFVLLLERLGPPPQIVWLTCGNTSNAELKRLLSDAGKRIFGLTKSGEPLVEISGL